MIGQVVAGYAITRKIGGGGMGAVYYGEHQTLGRPAAIKVLLPQFSSNPEVIQRFFNEARSTGLIRHPGLVDIFDFGQLPSGEAYLAMEYLQGEALSSRLRRTEKLSRDGVLHITRQIALAVGAAHNKGIIHRDLKPDNIFLVYDEDLAHGMRAKVLDFGVAKLTQHGEEQNAFQTNISAVLGTPRYMSPEQCRGAGLVEPRSDIYSLGCMMYEMVTGVSPFTGDVGDLLVGHMKEEPKPPKERTPGTPDWLNDMILQMLKKEPADRPRSMAEVVAEIDAHLARPNHENSQTVKTPILTGPNIPNLATQVSPPTGDATLINDPGNSTALIVKPITTMSGVASQKTPAATFVPRKSGRAGLWIGVASAAAAIVAISVLAMNRGRNRDGQTTVGASQPKPEPAAPVVKTEPSAKPNEPRPNEPRPNEPRPNEPRPNEPVVKTEPSTKPNEPKPNEPRPNEPRPNEPKPATPTQTVSPGASGPTATEGERELTAKEKASLRRKQLRDEKRRQKATQPASPFMF